MLMSQRELIFCFYICMWATIHGIQSLQFTPNKITQIFTISSFFLNQQRFPHSFQIQPLFHPLSPASHLILAKYHFLHNNKYYVTMERLSKMRGELGGKQEFRYSTDRGCLSLQQRRFYEENGYIVIRKLLKDEDIEKWRARFVEYCDSKAPPLPGMQIVRDISLVKKNKEKQLTGEANITKLQDFQYDDILQSYCTNPDLVPYLRNFCGDNIKSVHTMFINKPPGMGSSSRHPFHQDLAYFPFGPAERIVAAWAALEDSNSENGSLNILPKTHKGRFYDHEYPNDGQVNKAYFGIKEYQKFEDNRINLEMKKGDIVFFHPLLIHGSGQNKSKGFRKSMCCHFAASECEYIPIEGTVQELVSKEIMSYASKKFPWLTDYHTIWRMKASLVCGQQFEGKL